MTRLTAASMMVRTQDLARPATAVLKRVIAEDSGQDLIEYALVMVFLAMGCVATMKGLAANLGIFFGGLGATLTSSV